MRLRKTVTVDKPVDKVFAYLSDFATTTEWDPGTVQTTRFLAPLLKPAVNRLGDRAEAGMRDALARL